MSNVTWIFLFIAAGMASFALATVWARRENKVRFATVLTLVLWLPMLAWASTEVLGWHKPLWAAWRVSGEGRILAQKLVRGVAIYLYVDVGRGEPRAIELPWSDRTAEALQKALRESRRRRRRGAMLKFDWSWDNNPPQFHPLPQPQLPIPKSAPPLPKRLERGA